MNGGKKMIAMSLLMLGIFILTVAVVIAITEGFKITFATVCGFFSLSWAFMIAIWSSWLEFVVEPALGLITGTVTLTLLSVSQLMLFLSWVFVLTIAVAVIVWTSQRDRPQLFA